MIHHQNADAMGLASALMRGITPLDVRHFEYYQGGECLSNAHWLGPWHRIRRYSRSVTQASICPRFCKRFVINHAILASTTGTLYLPKPDKNFRWYGLRQNHRKIIGKTKKSAFCVPYSVIVFCA
jgi:hypothetical protein